MPSFSTITKRETIENVQDEGVHEAPKINEGMHFFIHRISERGRNLEDVFYFLFLV